MHDMLEIRVLYPNQKMIQQLSIPRVTAMCHSGGWFYASTAPASVNTSLSPASSAAVTTNNTDYSSSRQSNKESSVGRNKPHSTGSSGNEIWLILSANRLKFIQDLVKQKEYELAICLARTGLYAGQNAVETLQITTLYAIHLYHEMKFPEALNLFTDLLINPKHVLTLFPGILSEQQLKQQHEGQITDYPCEISVGLSNIYTIMIISFYFV
ncbi:unnamed protein product [Trichobilharzia regenti]|nr:unnamed protein product [Trichobilharzia regenti]